MLIVIRTLFFFCIRLLIKFSYFSFSFWLRHWHIPAFVEKKKLKNSFYCKKREKDLLLEFFIWNLKPRFGQMKNQFVENKWRLVPISISISLFDGRLEYTFSINLKFSIGWNGKNVNLLWTYQTYLCENLFSDLSFWLRYFEFRIHKTKCLWIISVPRYRVYNVNI